MLRWRRGEGGKGEEEAGVFFGLEHLRGFFLSFFLLFFLPRSFSLSLSHTQTLPHTPSPSLPPSPTSRPWPLPSELEQCLGGRRSARVGPREEVELRDGACLSSPHVLQVERADQVVVAPDVFRNQMDLWGKRGNCLVCLGGGWVVRLLVLFVFFQILLFFCLCKFVLLILFIVFASLLVLSFSYIFCFCL